MFQVEKYFDCGIIILKNPYFEDQRGDFFKSYNYENFKKFGINFIPKEHFYSFSKKNVLRGLHFQINEDAHQKLVNCIQGRVLDVCVDVRKESKFFNEPIAIELSEKNNRSIFIPKGFAHGFLSLEEDSLLQYMTSTGHSPKNDMGVLWSSIDFNWPISNPRISKRDSLHPPIGENLWKF